MKHKKLWHIIPVILVLICLSGCTFLSPPTKNTSHDGGFGWKEEHIAEGHFPLEPVLNMMNNPDFGGDASTVTSIFSIKGEDIDDLGNARMWVIGYNDGKNSSFLIYSQNGLARVPIAGKVSENAVNIENIVLPSKLMEKNKKITEQFFFKIGSNNATLELINGRYILTQKYGEPSNALTFDAKEGVPVQN